MTSLSENTVVTTSGGLVELGYKEKTTNVTITGTSTASPTTIIDDLTIVADGSPVIIEIFGPMVYSSGGLTIVPMIFIDGSYRWLGEQPNYGAQSTGVGGPIHAVYRTTLSAGVHTINLKAFKNNATYAAYWNSGTGNVGDNYLPSFIRVSKVIQASQFIVPLASASLVTSLPSTGNIDGQEVRYLVDDTNGTIWNLRWRASANRWEPISGFESDRNRIINGAMLIDERRRNTSASAQTDIFVADRFRFLGSGGGNANVQTVTNDGPTGVSTSSAKITVATQDTSLAAGDYYLLRQGIEGNVVQDLGFGSANTPITLSFYVKSSVTGLYGGSFRNPGDTRCYVFTYNINSANTWERKIISLTVDNTGTYGTGTNNAFFVVWSLGHGSGATSSTTGWQAGAYNQTTGCTNLFNTASATWQLSGVQLELGPTATPFQQRSYEQELNKCQRYYLRHDAFVYFDGASGNSTVARGGVQFPCTMRAVPVVTTFPGQSLSGSSNNVYISNTNSSTSISAPTAYIDGFDSIGNPSNLPGAYLYGFSYTASAEIS